MHQNCLCRLLHFQEESLFSSSGAHRLFAFTRTAVTVSRTWTDVPIEGLSPFARMQGLYYHHEIKLKTCPFRYHNDRVILGRWARTKSVQYCVLENHSASERERERGREKRGRKNWSHGHGWRTDYTIFTSWRFSKKLRNLNLSRTLFFIVQKVEK